LLEEEKIFGTFGIHPQYASFYDDEIEGMKER
jgi:hypothetical protein